PIPGRRRIPEQLLIPQAHPDEGGRIVVGADAVGGETRDRDPVPKLERDELAEAERHDDPLAGRRVAAEPARHLLRQRRAARGPSRLLGEQDERAGHYHATRDRSPARPTW